MRRIIDADALKDYIVIHNIGCGCSEDYQKSILEAIDDQPTIDPVRKGKWIDETFKPWGLVHHPYKCNQCGEHSETDSKFCPNCGAKMEEGGQDG